MRMTNEEALDELNVIYERLSHPEYCEQGVYSFRDGDYLEALDMAIKALEQQPCEDCISRQETLSHKHIVYDDDGIGYSVVRVDEIMALPSVTPKQKTGRWLMPQQDDGMSDPIYYQVRCSECGFDLDPQTWHMELHQYGADKYCPACGARMAESEDKE